MYQVISFSLYGAERIYCEGALQNAELSHNVFPGWVCRFYIDTTVPKLYKDALIERGAEVVEVTNPSLGPMCGHFWRMWAAADPRINRFIVRDADSRINSREKAAVEDWIQSGKKFHLMRDSVHHRTRALGGMWGAVGGAIPNICDLIDHWSFYHNDGDDDKFTSEILFPLMQGDYICHDAAGYFDDGKPFPPHPPLNGTRFVGERVEVDGPPNDIWRQSAEFENRWFMELSRARELEFEKPLTSLLFRRIKKSA